MIYSQQKHELTFEELRDGFRAIGLSGSDTILVQSSFAALRRVRGGPETVIKALLNILEPNGTLIMPTFNWMDFGEKKFYSKLKTKSQTGVLSELLMKWEGCKRIYHPFHGFSLVGKKAEELSKKVKNESSFESSSLFGELHRMNAKLMLLGVNYAQSFTFFHYIEESIGVPYRKFITLEGQVEELDGAIHPSAIKYYGRNSMELRYDLNKIEPLLEAPENSVVTVGKIGTATAKIMNAHNVYERLAPALKNNPNLVLL